MVVPVMSPIGPGEFVEIIRRPRLALEQGDVTRRSVLLDERQLDAVFALHRAAAELRPAGMALARELASHPERAGQSSRGSRVESAIRRQPPPGNRIHHVALRERACLPGQRVSRGRQVMR
jgi:hypothetical protein